MPVARFSFPIFEGGFNLADIEAIRTVDDLNNILGRIARLFGFREYCIYDDLRPDPGRAQPSRIVSSLPEAFHAGIDSIHAEGGDDFLQRVWRGSIPAFWSLDTVRAKPDAALAAALLAHFAHYDISCGINIPQMNKIGRLSVLSFSGHRDAMQPDEIEALNYIAILLLKRFDEIADEIGSRGQDAINPMELKFLQAYADGLETDMLAQRFSLSVPTVTFILESVRRKLHADTLPHAVAEAIRRGVID